MSTGSIADNGGLVKSVWFPRAILPTATVLFNLAQYILTVLVFLPLMLVYYDVPPAPPMLLFPIFVGLQSLFTIGVALILATSAAFFRDVRHLVDVGLAVGFWATPIVYELGRPATGLRRLVFFSPLSPYVSAYHDIFYYRQWPDGAVWLTAIAYAGVTLGLGLWLLVRNEDSFAERI
jgi:lipopolysaccharide transport system permease protein